MQFCLLGGADWFMPSTLDQYLWWNKIMLCALVKMICRSVGVETKGVYE